jgi:hypothetical protein
MGEEELKKIWMAGALARCCVDPHAEHDCRVLCRTRYETMKVCINNQI